MKERSNLKVLAMASSIRWPACVSQGMEAIATKESMLTGMTSRPIPSPGNRPILSDLEAIDDCLGSSFCLAFRRFEFPTPLYHTDTTGSAEQAARELWEIR